MKCNEFIDRVDDYLDDLLEGSEANEFRKHIDGCPSCADELEGIRELRQRVSALQRSQEPPRDLWPGIAARITGENVVHGRFGNRALLAAAAAVVVFSLVVTAYFIGRSQAVISRASPAAVEQGPSEVLLASFEGLGVDDFVATRTELLEALEARRHELSPETMEVVTENLLLIDQAMDRIAEALGENPDNEFLMKQLAAAYRRQIGLLQRAVRLPAEV
jgi:anti-sigma factor RsiW